MNRPRGFAAAELAVFTAIAGSNFTPLTGLLVLRVIGVFVAPLGAILGFF